MAYNVYGDQDRAAYFSGYDIYQGVSGYDMYRANDRSKFLGGYDGEPGLGIVPLAIAGSVISGISSLFGGGADAGKYKDRTNTINALNVKAQAGDEASILELEYIGHNGHNWGTAYKKLNQAAAAAALAARVKQAKANAVIPAPGQYASPVTSAMGVTPTLMIAGAALLGGYLLLRKQR